MKKLAIIVAALTLSIGSFAQKKADELAKFKTETIDLGKIKQDVPTTATFEVTNISSEPLIIEQANPTCGCTIGDYTKEPIMPGKSGVIKATYNAKNLNAFEKHLTVKFAGSSDMKSITIKGEVLSAEDYAKQTGAASPAATDDKMKSDVAPAKSAPQPVKAAGARQARKTATKASNTVKP